MVFLPRDPELYETAKAAIHKVAVNLGNEILGWRKVPTDNRCAGGAWGNLGQLGATWDNLGQRDVTRAWGSFGQRGV